MLVLQYQKIELETQHPLAYENKFVDNRLSDEHQSQVKDILCPETGEVCLPNTFASQGNGNRNNNNSSNETLNTRNECSNAKHKC